MNNHSGSAQGQAGPVMHFLLRLPWKLPRLWHCICPPCCYCIWPDVMCVCGWCSSLIIRGLLRRENRRLALQLHTEDSKSARLRDNWEPNGSHTKSHIEKPSIVQKHICNAENMCQSVAEERAKILNDRGHCHWCLGWLTWINIQIFSKTLSSDTD